MTASRGPDERVVLPRWRSWRTSENQRELGSLGPGVGALEQVTTAEDARRELRDRINEFKLHQGSIHHAADVVSTAVVLGLEDQNGVRDAADKLLDAPSQSARTLARRLIFGTLRSSGNDQAPGLYDEASLSQLIARQKCIVREQPRNVLAWTDLALAHTALGHDDAAERSIRIALAQANGNRFVLRAAARFYMHCDDYVNAHRILTGDKERLRGDPWLLAAEIAISDSSDKPQQYANYARSLLDRGFSPHDLSELASALATIELKHGKIKQARKLLTTALVDPTDNTLAQVEWSAQQGVDVGGAQNLDLSCNFEAMARYHYRNEEFDEALKYGEQWLADQPFALDPALFTSYVAATFVEDQETAIRVCQVGLRANRNNSILLNNLAFSLASAGRVPEAREVIDRQATPASTYENAIKSATRGLIAFRGGDASAGRALYRQAVDALVKDRNSVAAASATLFWVYEELRAGGSDFKESLKLAKLANSGIGTSPELALSRHRLRGLIERRSRENTVSDDDLKDLSEWRNSD
jgi:tetratricopeptide (TPR) repeat protein